MRPLVILQSFGLWSVLLLAPSLVAAAGQPASSFENATGELRAFCIEKLCLGMTIPEVVALGRLEWRDGKVPDGSFRCSENSNLVVGDYVGENGSAFTLIFQLTTTVGAPELRYRLNNASIKLIKLSSTQIDHLTELLKNRYGPMKVSVKDSLWYTTTRTGAFDIRLFRMPTYLDMPAELSLAFTYRANRNWIMSQPSCQTGMPTL